VLVNDGIAYFAAGIVNYDGTYVYALDAATGQIKWQNNTSGHLDPEARTGVSVQGHMILHDSRLYLAGGNAISPAVYDITNGKCLNNPDLLRQVQSISPRGWELFLLGEKVMACGRPFYADPKYDVYDATVFNKMLLASTGNRDITWVNNRKIMCYPHGPENQYEQFLKGWGQLKIPDLNPLWEYNCDPSVAVAICKNAVVVAKASELVALNLQNGQMLWNQPLPSSPVPWGLAVDRDGRILVTLKGGKIFCFGQKN